MASEDVLTGLNSQQARAVTFDFHRHCLVLAGAGCGKTAVLSRRIAWCCRSFCPPPRILAMTFTRKAATEMQLRLKGLRGEDAELPWITTFHGFGYAVLRAQDMGEPNWRRIGYRDQPRILAQDGRLELLARISTSRQRTALEVQLRQLDSWIACLQVAPHKLSWMSEERRGILRDILARFTLAKRQAGLWEFADMIEKAIELFSQQPLLAQTYSRRFDHILVDEFQDTNPRQIDLLRILMAGGASLFAVGDDDQAIYGFRGADHQVLACFTEQFRNAEVLKLEINYRNRPRILSTANRILSDKPPQLRKVLRSGKFGAGGKERGVRPGKRLFADEDTMLAWLRQKLEAVAAELRVPIGAIAVLCRTNETAETMARRLARIGLGALPQTLTVHASKGLEFPAVFLLDLEESVFPSYRTRKGRVARSWRALVSRWLWQLRHGRAEGAEDLAEERRLFYVAVTRAEHRLFLLSVHRKRVMGRVMVMAPSRFLKLV
jgi:superfamily I DNA/RNA helicase